MAANMHAGGGGHGIIGDVLAALLRARAFYQQPGGLFWHALLWNALSLVAQLLWCEQLLLTAEAWLLRCCACALPLLFLLT